MTLNYLKILILSIIIISFNSCSSQVNSETPNAASELGKIVANIDSKIWQVFEDLKGNYWFGSNGQGVYLYDGKTLTQFTNEDGLVDMQIRGIQEDKLGNVFIETPKGISKYDGKTFTTLTPITSASNKWKLESDDLWFNCNSNAQEVYRYDGDSLFELSLPKTNLKVAFGMEIYGLGFKDMNPSPYAVFGIDKDKAGNLWIGTITAGAYRFDGESFLHITEKELTALPDGRVPGVRSMLEDKNGYMWLSNFKSKYHISDKAPIYDFKKLKGADMTKEHFQDRIGYFNSGLADEEGNLWMTTYGGGIWKYDGNVLLNIPIFVGETEALLISMYLDSHGIMWLGTDNLGVLKFNGEKHEVFEPWKNKEMDQFLQKTDISSFSGINTQSQFEDTIAVSTSEELIKNIKNNRVIKLASSDYMLPSTLLLDGINNLSIIGSDSSHLKITDQNTCVLALINCNNILFENLIIGHGANTVQEGEPGILRILHSSDIDVSNCTFKPGATFGLVTNDVSNMEFKNSTISNCTTLLFELEKSQNILFENTKFHDNNLGVSVLGGFTNSTRDVTFSHCEFMNNTPAEPGNPAFNFMENWKDFDDKIIFANCTFKNNKGYTWNGDKIKLIDCDIRAGDFVGFGNE